MSATSQSVAEQIQALRQAVEASKLATKQRESDLLRKEEEMRKVKLDASLLQARIEEEEEFIANTLMCRLEVAKQEKAHLAQQVEKEEFFLNNTLHKRLEKVRQEKVNLELHLEMEQEYIVNKLQKQLSEVIRQKNALQAKLGEGHGGLITKLEQSLDQYKESLQPQTEDTQRQAILHLETQIQSMQDQQQKLDAEAKGYRKKCTDLEKRLEEVKKDHFIMQAKAHRFREKLQQLQTERQAELLRSEVSEEWSFNNRVRRSRDNLAALRSRSASETVSRLSPKGACKPQSIPTRARSQSFTRGTPMRTSLGKLRHGPVKTSPVGSPAPGDRFPRASSRTELRSHTEELLQMSPCVSHHSPRSGRFTMSRTLTTPSR